MKNGKCLDVVVSHELGPRQTVLRHAFGPYLLLLLPDFEQSLCTIFHGVIHVLWVSDKGDLAVAEGTLHIKSELADALVVIAVNVLLPHVELRPAVHELPARDALNVERNHHSGLDLLESVPFRTRDELRVEVCRGTEGPRPVLVVVPLFGAGEYGVVFMILILSHPQVGTLTRREILVENLAFTHGSNLA